MSSLIDSLMRTRTIGADDVVRLRQAVFGGDAVVSQAEAEALIRLDSAALADTPQWNAFYTEALTDFLVRQQSPAGYVDEAGAAWLIRALSDTGSGGGQSTLGLLAHILDQADEVPPSLTEFTLSQARAKVIEDGRVSPTEVELIRRALYAPASGGNIAITRAEAEVLFDINDACRGAANDPAWADLFSKAVVASVMTVSGYRGLSRQEALRRQIWLATPESPGGFFHRMTSGLADVWRRPQDAFTDDSEDDIAADNRADEAAYRAAEPIDAGEAEWLIDRIKADGVFDDAERRVVDFLRNNAPAIHPSFRPMLESAPASPSTSGFGRRGSLSRHRRS